MELNLKLILIYTCNYSTWCQSPVFKHTSQTVFACKTTLYTNAVLIDVLSIYDDSQIAKRFHWNTFFPVWDKRFMTYTKTKQFCKPPPTHLIPTRLLMIYCLKATEFANTLEISISTQPLPCGRHKCMDLTGKWKVVGFFSACKNF